MYCNIPVYNTAHTHTHSTLEPEHTRVCLENRNVSAEWNLSMVESVEFRG